MAAARALARLGTPVADLTDFLVRGVTGYAGRDGLVTILELRAVRTIPALEELIAADDRLPVPGSVDDVVWADELLAERIHATVALLRAG
ncbi:hypothetical protein [Dactylosporangium sp. CA-092794]|uniref:hypothetical protein n=1 Tax=Dactylosporangium sp. CA-092794 TaxID=3239929 RepID=UPI003D923732